MKPLTATESKALLALFKDFGTPYNANTLSKKLDVTRAGSLKIVRHLDGQGLLVGRTYGKSTFYKLNLSDPYARSVVDMLLRSEARDKAKRWLLDFEEFFQHTKAAIIFGSAIRDYEKAHDIDILLVLRQHQVKPVQALEKKFNQLSIKPLHILMQSPKDIANNLKKPDVVILNALRFGYVLHGYSLVIAAVKKAQDAHGIFAVPEPKRR